MIRVEGLRKSFGDVRAVRRRRPARRARRDPRAARPERGRQVDHAALPRRNPASRRGHDRARRAAAARTASTRFARGSAWCPTRRGCTAATRPPSTSITSATCTAFRPQCGRSESPNAARALRAGRPRRHRARRLLARHGAEGRADPGHAARAGLDLLRRADGGSRPGRRRGHAPLSRRAARARRCADRHDPRARRGGADGRPDRDHAARPYRQVRARSTSCARESGAGPAVHRRAHGARRGHRAARRWLREHTLRLHARWRSAHLHAPVGHAGGRARRSPPRCSASSRPAARRSTSSRRSRRAWNRSTWPRCRRSGSLPTQRPSARWGRQLEAPSSPASPPRDVRLAPHSRAACCATPFLSM